MWNGDFLTAEAVATLTPVARVLLLRRRDGA
jgi:hypothetical protein